MKLEKTLTLREIGKGAKVFELQDESGYSMQCAFKSPYMDVQVDGLGNQKMSVKCPSCNSLCPLFKLGAYAETDTEKAGKPFIGIWCVSPPIRYDLATGEEKTSELKVVKPEPQK